MGQLGKIIGVGAVCLGLAAGCGEGNANAQNPGAAQVPEEVRMALQGCAGSPEAHKYFLDQAVADAQKNTAVVLKAACGEYLNKVKTVNPDTLKKPGAQKYYAGVSLRLAQLNIESAAKKAEIAKIQARREEKRIKHNRECAKANKVIYDGAIKTGATPELAERIKIPCE